MIVTQRKRLTRGSQKGTGYDAGRPSSDQSALSRHPVDSVALRVQTMERGNGIPPSSPLRGSCPSRVGATRMRLGQRRREEANAWGHAQERLTSSRCAARESGASEAMRQNPGTLPEGGLASHAMAESPPACLPPPKADVPSHATWSDQDGTQATETTHKVMVCTGARGAARDPRESRETHCGPRWGEGPHSRATLAPRPHPLS